MARLYRGGMLIHWLLPKSALPSTGDQTRIVTAVKNPVAKGHSIIKMVICDIQK